MAKHFRIADTFTASLAKLTNDEQKAAKITVFDLQQNPDQTGLRWHKLAKLRDKHFASVSVNMDLRLIVHRTDDSLLICYVDHHDKAYAWAERRKLERHPKTGAAQLVEVRETVREIEVPVYVDAESVTAEARPKQPLFQDVDDADLLGYGVPAAWLAEVKAADEDSLFDLAEHLPGEAAEALLMLAVGETPVAAEVAPAEADPFEHPDAKRRFRLVASSDELQRALDFPWERWAVFLHPSQRAIVEREFNGPARVAGSAGTGKTVVAMHRAVGLARRYSGARVLLTTFSITLARMLRRKLAVLTAEDAGVADRIQVRAIDQVGLEVYEQHLGNAQVATEGMIRQLIEQAAKAVEGHKFSTAFLFSEWTDVVDCWRLSSWEEYRDVQRLGRKTRLGEKQRRILWDIFGRVHESLANGGLVTMPEVFSEASRLVAEGLAEPATHVVVDEAQDILVPQLRFLAALAGDRDDGLFFAGDQGQRIFQTPFSWKSMGVDVRGRSRVLKVNYRTSHQIRSMADKLLGETLSDVDGNSDERNGTVSAFNGPKPEVQVFGSEDDEVNHVASWLTRLLGEGLPAHEIGVFVRSAGQVPRAKQVVETAGIKASRIDRNTDPAPNQLAVGLMHDAKGLEFRAVAVMACDEEVVPLQERIENITDEADLETVYETERHLLYVACTRARDHLLVTGLEPGSDFIEDIFAT